jgi:putative transposase
MAIRRASHCVYGTRSRLVWAPKYRKWVLHGAIRQRVRELFCEIAGHHGFEIEELDVDRDHVHLFCFSVFRRSTRPAREWGC